MLPLGNPCLRSQGEQAHPSRFEISELKLSTGSILL
jgi:hypothetical protein